MTRKNSALGAWLLIAASATTASGQAFSPAPHAPSPQTPPPTEGVFLNLPRFEIPFSVARTGSPPVEVQLYYSRNGQPWEMYGAQPASSRTFQFETAQDGVFWFTTRTIDAHGASHPAGPLAPQLKVTVDTSNPQVEAAVDADGNGHILLDYQITDVSADQDGLQVQYMTDAVQQWMPVTGATQPQAENLPGGGIQGRLAWNPQSAWRQAYVRLIVRDRAGNQTVVTRQIERPRIARAPMHLASTGGRAEYLPAPAPGPQYHGAPAESTPAVGQRVPMEAFGPNPPQQSAETGYPSATPLPRQSGAGPHASGPGYSAHPNTPQNRWRGYAGQPTAGPGLNPAHPNPADARSAAGPAEAPPSHEPRNAAGTLPAEAMRPISLDPLASASQSSDASPPAAEETSAPPRVTAPAAGNLPAGEVPRMSRSKKFSLDYEVDAVGSAGVEDVELWGTHDGGQSWQRWGIDPDRLSPFDIEVNGEGTYGFSIVVVGANGLVSPRPLDGEPADIYVHVDATSPAVRLTAAQYGEGDETGSLIIRYSCSDAALAERPVSLAFAASPEGPWTTIATGLENTGQYRWPADPQLPRQIYLRIEAIDRAGNVGTHTLDLPINVQGLAPRARIRGFSPIDQSAAVGLPSERHATTPQARFR